MTDEEQLEYDIAQLGMSRPEVTWDAIRRIEARGAAAVPALLRTLAEDRLGGAGRGLVLRILGTLALPETLPAVAAALHDTRHVTRTAALTAVACFPGSEATSALEAMLADPDPDIRRQAAAHLAYRAGQP
jgi:hypothetical protein